MNELRKQYEREVTLYVTWLEEKVEELRAIIEGRLLELELRVDEIDAAVEPAAVEPWDGLFVGSLSIWRLTPDGKAESMEDTGAGLDLEEVGLDWDTILEATMDGYVEEWDGLFVGQHFLTRLEENGSLSIVAPLDKSLTMPCFMSLGEALCGYAA